MLETFHERVLPEGPRRDFPRRIEDLVAGAQEIVEALGLLVVDRAGGQEDVPFLRHRAARRHILRGRIEESRKTLPRQQSSRLQLVLFSQLDARRHGPDPERFA